MFQMFAETLMSSFLLIFFRGVEGAKNIIKMLPPATFFPVMFVSLSFHDLLYLILLVTSFFAVI